MRNPGGVLISTDPFDGVQEHDTFTCEHCQKVSGVRPGQKPEDIGGLCKQCMGLLCPLCADKAVCTPWEKQMEIAEAKDQALRSYGF